MSGLAVVGFAMVVFVAGYIFYGRWLTKKWGIDPNAITPAVRKNDKSFLRPAAVSAVRSATDPDSPLRMYSYHNRSDFPGIAYRPFLSFLPESINLFFIYQKKHIISTYYRSKEI